MRRTPPGQAFPRVGAWAASIAPAIALLGACQGDRGEVELDWTIVDRAGAQVFPSGALGDTCSFVGRLPDRGDDPVDYSVQVEVRLCEPGCVPGCDDLACIVDRLIFDCTAARGYATVETQGEPYDFSVRLLASPADGSCACDIQAPCALVPGPRRRTVEPGLVTDLAVYLMVLGLDDIDASVADDGRVQLDLAPAAAAAGEACCVPDPSCGS